MTLLINQVLFSFEMRKYASFAEMNMILMNFTKAPKRIWALVKDESWFEDLWNNRHNPDYLDCWEEDSLGDIGRDKRLKNLLICSLVL